MAAHIPTDPSHPTAATFQQRRRDTWKAIRIWVVIEALAILALAIVTWSKLAHAPSSPGLFEPFRYDLSLGDTTPWQLNLTLLMASALVAATIAIAMAVQRHYRCPKCETVPMGSAPRVGSLSLPERWSVELNPASCPKCRAKLR